MDQLKGSTFVRYHQVCTGKRAAHVWCARRYTHTHMTPNVRQREREAREGLSVHVETARSIDPAISETETRLSKAIKEAQWRAITRIRLASPKDRRTIDDPGHRSRGTLGRWPISDFSAESRCWHASSTFSTSTPNCCAWSCKWRYGQTSTNFLWERKLLYKRIMPRRKKE